VAVERLLEGGRGVVLFYCNANIFPREEWERRLEGVRKVGEHFNVAVEVEPWNGAAWLRGVGEGREGEREGGARCAACFEWRLQRTFSRARELGLEAFSTSLTTGPRKRAEQVFEAGRKAGGDAFVAEDFKKRGGFQRSVELARELGLHRQNYCGCEFSMEHPKNQDCPRG
jgi:predicted adenine nucleotide alpha hydrolase (AANH) superfamily ATPase